MTLKLKEGITPSQFRPVDQDIQKSYIAKRDDIANGAADGVDAAKDAAKRVGHDIGKGASKVSHFFFDF